MCKKKHMAIIELRVIKESICEHNPKAQSVCYPDTMVDFNEFQENILKQLNNYDTKRSVENHERIRVRKKNRNN
jgi:hypothetical protein